MPYEIEFAKQVTPAHRDDYINDCCIGGDVVAYALLPAVQSRYGADIDPGQEDWGWLIPFKSGGVHLDIAIHTDDADAGAFRIHLTSRVKRSFFSREIEDTAELHELRTIVTSALETWGASAITVRPMNSDYM